MKAPSQAPESPRVLVQSKRKEEKEYYKFGNAHGSDHRIEHRNTERQGKDKEHWIDFGSEIKF